MKNWIGTRQLIVIVCCLVFLSTTCLIAIEESERDGPRKSSSKEDYLSKVKETLNNLAKSFKRDPLTSLEPLQKTLIQQETKLNDIKTEISDILKLVPTDPLNSKITKRSLKSAEDLPSCPVISPLLQRVLIVHQVKFQLKMVFSCTCPNKIIFCPDCANS